MLHGVAELQTDVMDSLERSKTWQAFTDNAMVGLTRIKEHDAYTAAHCVNVATLVLAVAFADGMDQSTCEMLASAALLHDIGKTKVPLEILNKPGRFEPHELAEMR